VGLPPYRPQDRQSLGRDLDSALTEEVRGVSGHGDIINQAFE